MEKNKEMEQFRPQICYISKGRSNKRIDEIELKMNDKETKRGTNKVTGIRRKKSISLADTHNLFIKMLSKEKNMIESPDHLVQDRENTFSDEKGKGKMTNKVVKILETKNHSAKQRHVKKGERTRTEDKFWNDEFTNPSKEKPSFVHSSRKKKIETNKVNDDEQEKTGMWTKTWKNKLRHENLDESDAEMQTYKPFVKQPHTTKLDSKRCNTYLQKVEAKSLRNESLDKTEIVQKGYISNRFLYLMILGPVGVGKTTLVNSIINYLTYSNLKEAKNNGAIIKLSNKFTVIEDRNYSQINEVTMLNKTKDDTSDKTCKQVTINYSGMKIHIIDTPGIGDNEGVEQDDMNIRQIVKHVQTLPRLDAICVVLKPNECKLDGFFRYSTTKTLEVAKSIKADCKIFCMTHTRSTFYKPGDTLPILKTLLEENEVKLNLTKELIYCVDNEAIRYLCTLEKTNLTYGKKEEEMIQESWDVSTLAVQNMLQYLKKACF